MENKWKMKLVLLLTVLGFIGIISIIPYSMATLMNDQSIPDFIPIPLVLAINSISSTVQIFIMVLLGVRMQWRTSLRAPILEGLLYGKKIPKISGKWMLIGILGSLIGTVIILLLEVFVFVPAIEMPEGQTVSTTWWQGLLAMFYGGFTEELMLRLFMMTLIVCFLAWISKKAGNQIPASYYYIGIILAAILFGLGHLPATYQIFGELTSILVIRALVLNGLLGIWFGYLYWKKGLEYAMIAHMSADFFLHVVFNSIFN